jgi:hypothetical protein
MVTVSCCQFAKQPVAEGTEIQVLLYLVVKLSASLMKGYDKMATHDSSKKNGVAR